MLITKRCFVFSNCFTRYLPVKKNGSSNFSRHCFTTLAKRKDSSEASTTQKQQPASPISWVSKALLPRVAVAIFGLGFIDAGYSGDWSRIGVISHETEAILKETAFVVVPICVFLIFSFSKQADE